MAKEQVGSVDGRLLKINIRDKGGFWLKQPSKILAEGIRVWSDITWEMEEDEEEPDQILRVIRCQGWGILAKLSRILSEVGKCKDRHRSPPVEDQLKESSVEPELGFVKETILVTSLLSIIKYGQDDFVTGDKRKTTSS